jgi:hypothetical protein
VGAEEAEVAVGAEAMEVEVVAVEATMTMVAVEVADAGEGHFLGLRSLPTNSGAPSSRWMIFKLEP